MLPPAQRATSQQPGESIHLSESQMCRATRNRVDPHRVASNRRHAVDLKKIDENKPSDMKAPVRVYRGFFLHANRSNDARRSNSAQNCPEEIIAWVTVSQVLTESLRVRDSRFPPPLGSPVTQCLNVMVHAVVLEQPVSLAGVGG